MATNRKTKKKEHVFSLFPPLQPLSPTEKEELKMRIIVAIGPTVAFN